MRATATAIIRSTGSIAPPVPIIPIRRRGPARGPASARCWAAPPGFSPVLARWQFREFGPVVAAGALVATLAGAGVGAAVGGLVGALLEAGIPREHADIYAEAVRRGGTLVTVRTDDALSDRVTDILNRHSPVDIEERAESWRQAGWKGFDERAEPYAGPSSTDRPLRTDLDTRPEARTSPTGGPDELQRDWEVRRNPSEIRPETGRNYVRIYPPVEAPVSDKR